MTRVVLVGNPTAQSGANAARIERARELCQARGLSCEIFPTRPAGATVPALAEALAKRPPDVVVAMGGDGTFREVGAALLASGEAERVRMGMLPTGTANDQGRSFGLSAGDDALEANVDVLANGHEVRLDAVRAALRGEDGAPQREDVWFDSMGWGLSARVLLERNVDRGVVERLGPLRHLYRDQLVYAGAFARVFVDSFVRDQTFDVALSIDGAPPVHLEGLTDLIVKNTRIYAGAWVLDRASRPDDGLVEVVPFRDQAEWIAKAVVDHDGNPLPDGLRDPLGVSADIRRGGAFELTFSGSVLPLAQLDGEEADPSPRASLRVVPRAIRLIAPSGR